MFKHILIMKREKEQPQRANNEVRPVVKYELEIEPETYCTSFWRKEQISKENYFQAIEQQIDTLINLNKFKL